MSAKQQIEQEANQALADLANAFKRRREVRSMAARVFPPAPPPDPITLLAKAVDAMAREQTHLATVMQMPVKPVYDAHGKLIATQRVAIPNLDQLAGIEKRVEELESRPTLRYLGVWKEGHYVIGSAVTQGGSVWIAERDTDQRPGDGESGWRLAVRAGRDYRPRER
jgi:hypothetical protein